MRADRVPLAPPLPHQPVDEALGDLRFSALLPAAAWARLPLSIRQRFSRRLSDGATVVYVGEVLQTTMSRVGFLFAQVARLIGAPLPLERGAGVPAVVTVTEDLSGGGQIWTRLYARRAGFPQIIHSSKRFAGPTGLEEHVGAGVGMTLTLAEQDGALVFRSADYFLAWRGLRLRLPASVTPGRFIVTHAELGDGRFLFTLELTHPLFGTLVTQSAAFREAKP
jgi:hypothetical protein